jgi:predicted nucleotidyltransferase
MVAIFGSFARGEEHVNSDVDILIDFNGQVDLLELIGIEQELSELLGFKVDLVTMRSVNNLLKPYIDADIIRIV